MTKAALESMIAALKDRCKKSMDSQLGSCTYTHCAINAYHKPVSVIGAEQVVSLTALIAYVAHTTGRAEFRVERDLSNYFCVPNPKCLPKDQYDRAIHYIVNQVPHHAANSSQ